VLDPASGALIVSPDLDLKIRKALRNEARRIAYRLYFAQAVLYPEFLWLKCKCALLNLASDFGGKLS
jgi:hypothetical protein